LAASEVGVPPEDMIPRERVLTALKHRDQTWLLANLADLSVREIHRADCFDKSGVHGQIGNVSVQKQGGQTKEEPKIAFA
jgi:hypothetical protein